MTKIATLFIVVLLAGCVAGPPPAYVVKLAGPRGAVCTGILLDPIHIITADHCLDAGVNRAQTMDGQSTATEPLERRPGVDMAVLRALMPLRIESKSYARIGQPRPGASGAFWGHCTEYGGETVGRVVFLQADGEACQLWLFLAPTCGGDSGGPIVQDGRVVGMLQTVAGTDAAGGAFGYRACARAVGDR